MGLSAGTRLGPYEILGPLGAGGMGEVLRARDTRLGRQVAVKILPDAVSRDPRRVSRFETEARALAALSHPNILAIHDFGQSEGRLYAVTELLDGETLRDRMTGKPLGWRKTSELAAAIADGLASAHAAGIVHRDLKPENVFLTSDGRVKILDFGLAKPSEAVSEDAITLTSPSGGHLSSASEIVGTLPYMAPEQLRGFAVDGRTDLFSLGSILYEMLAGKRPFAGATPADTIAAILYGEPRPLEGTKGSEIPPVLSGIVSRCLEKRREDRFDTAHDLAIALRSISSGQAAAGSLARSGRPYRRRWAAAALAGAAALAVILGLALLISVKRRGSVPASSFSLLLSFPVDTASGALNFNPLALSPDGKTLVFAGSSLLVRPLDRDEIRTIPGTDGAYFPFFSPDGREVGFFADGKLKRVSLAGGEPVSICDAPAGRGGSWGADGIIVFSPNTTAGLQRISAAGGEPRALTTTNPALFESHRYPQILPGEKSVLFQVMQGNGINRAAVASLETGDQRVLLENAAYPRYLRTGHLAFSRPGRLLAVPFDLRTLQTIGSPREVLTDLATNYAGMRCANLDVSQDGTLVYQPSRVLRRKLAWVDWKGGADELPFPADGYREIALSPDGQRLAAITIDASEQTTLILGDIRNGTIRRLAVEGLFQGLVWSRDGTRIAFGFAPREGESMWKAYWQRADGSGEPERLTTEPGLQQELPTSFSRDGRLVVLSIYGIGDGGSKQTGWDIFTASLGADRVMAPYLRTESHETDGRLSPNGSWIAYYSVGRGRQGIFVRRFPQGREEWQISAEWSRSPRWSPDGKKLFYRRGEEVRMVDVDADAAFRVRQSRTLFEANYILFHDDYDVAPDGAHFLMIKPDPTELRRAEVKVVLNWFEALRPTPSNRP